MAPVDLRDERFFMNFPECPGPAPAAESMPYIVPDPHVLCYFVPDGTLKELPEKHWCLIAEWKQTAYLTSDLFRLYAQDKCGNQFPIDFGKTAMASFNKKLLKPGRTLAILYANKGDCLGTEHVIIIKGVSSVSVLPMPMQELFLLSDKIQEQHREKVNSPGSAACCVCGKVDETTKKCTGCKMFLYCSTDCQIVGWNEKGHKKECKVLKQIGWLFEADWEKFENNHRFRF